MNKPEETESNDQDFFLKRELGLGLSLGPLRTSPEPLFSSSPSPQPLPDQEISQLIQIETPAATVSPDPSFLLSHNHVAATTTPHMAPPTGPSFHTAAAVVAPSLQLQEASPEGPRVKRVRRNPTQAPRDGKSENVPPPFPWATNRRATVHSLNTLLSNNIETITGAVQCKRCEKQYVKEFNLQEKFRLVGEYIAENKHSMHDRAPDRWMNPELPNCDYCNQERCVKPVISQKKKSINWLFLLLGEMVGCCTLDQLKYFCKHTKNHRTGAKDRVLYLTYLELCKQLRPDGPFAR
ncbi:uncharacterized protein LOC110605849 [Manihot esculenta]|uniref:DUF7086 domain-containing protein n=1 Tax=Manihot esculenta TaxID=3983 RepID=A0A2C9U2D8_MANES|nr:uncharacterized protein LOC110605849 [Manihot esculenta]OAY23456.1 hypothetical protein MANES_18G080400v8 [Manihot esculenta]